MDKLIRNHQFKQTNIKQIQRCNQIYNSTICSQLFYRGLQTIFKSVRLTGAYESRNKLQNQLSNAKDTIPSHEKSENNLQVLYSKVYQDWIPKDL